MWLIVVFFILLRSTSFFLLRLFFLLLIFSHDDFFLYFCRMIVMFDIGVIFVIWFMKNVGVELSSLSLLSSSKGG